MRDVEPLVVPFGAEGHEYMTFGPAGGWAYVNLADLGATAWVQFAEGGPPGHRIAIRTLHLAADDFLAGAQLRSFPLHLLEAAANHPTYYDEIRLRIWEVPKSSPPDFTTLAPTTGPVPSGRRLRQKLRALPQGGRRPDEFYKEVAEVYSTALSRGSRHAALDVAAANGVPVTTVHRWVKEARRRGLLAPARPQGGRHGPR